MPKRCPFAYVFPELSLKQTAEKASSLLRWIFLYFTSPSMDTSKALFRSLPNPYRGGFACKDSLSGGIYFS